MVTVLQKLERAYSKAGLVTGKTVRKAKRIKAKTVRRVKKTRTFKTGVKVAKAGVKTHKFTKAGLKKPVTKTKRLDIGKFRFTEKKLRTAFR